MSQHNTGVSLRQILDHALEAVAMTEGKTRADLDEDRQQIGILLQFWVGNG
jgi:hypothetical protein